MPSKIEFFPKLTGVDLEFRDRARALVDSEIRPYAVEDDKKDFFRQDVLKALAREKLTAITLPKEFGGLGHKPITYYVVIEEIARGMASWAVTLGVTNLIQGALLQFGTPEQKKKFLTPLIKGEMLGAFSLSESGSGSDAASLRLQAKKVAGGYQLTGSKMWCSNAGIADLYLVMGRTGEAGAKGISSFVVPKESPGFRVGKRENKLGLRGSSLAELIFEECFVPEAHRVGAEGQGFTVALSQLDAGRVSIAACGSGLSTEALERVWENGTGKSIPFPEGTRLIFANHFANLQAVKALIHLTAELKPSLPRITTLASQCKLLSSELSVQITSDAIDAFGALGTQTEMGLERLLRDAKALPIVEGTNQIQKQVLARELDRMETA